MSLITCCPACGTMFRVVPDQLKVSEGWVRCGHCSEVFDATAHMVEAVPEPAEPLTAADEVQVLPDAVAAPRPAGAGRNTQGAKEGPASVAATAAPAAAASAAPTTAAKRMPDSTLDVPDSVGAPHSSLGVPDSTLEESPLDRPFVFRRSDLADSDETPSVSPPLASRFEPTESELESDDQVDDLTFIRQARRKAFWARPSVRALLGLIAVSLAGLLAVQFAYQHRDRLAAAEPALVPWLQRLCELADCRLGPPRQIEAIAIENSAFNKLRPDAYRLSFTLRNSAPNEVAVPAMELTLTDASDQPVLRRVLSPVELGARSPVIAGASEWATSVAIGVEDNGNGSRIAGYRLLAFYP